MSVDVGAVVGSVVSRRLLTNPLITVPASSCDEGTTAPAFKPI